MPLRRCAAALALAALVVPASAAAAPAAKPLKLRLADDTKTVTIPENDAVGGVFADSQRLSANCKQTERPVAPGLISAPRPLASQSFGFATSWPLRHGSARSRPLRAAGAVRQRRQRDLRGQQARRGQARARHTTPSAA